MARLARVVFPGLPHHVTQRGNGRAQTFIGDADYALYRELLARSCRTGAVEVWAWVLMPNHVHLILVPADGVGCGAPSRRLIDATPVISTGAPGGAAIFGRAASAPLPWMRSTSARALRVALNPVRARLVEPATDWPWSSVHAHLAAADDGIKALAPVRYPRFAELIEVGADAAAFERLRRAESIGRPLGDGAFLARLETAACRRLKPLKRGPKPSQPADAPRGS